MINLSFLHKRPLILLQIAGWAIYIFSDYYGHVKSGIDLFYPSFGSGFFALFITGAVAITYRKVKPYGLVIQSYVSVFALYLAMVIWSKVHMVMHGDAETLAGVPADIANVFQGSLQQWLTPDKNTILLFLSWATLFLVSKWVLANREQHIALKEALVETKQAQLQTLRYQLNPHFLFNILNSLDVSVLSGDKKTAHKMIQHLSSFLRSSLEQGEQDKITLKQEFDVLHEFVSIEELRFGDSLEVSLSMNDECKSIMIPPMLLQPLVENAIKYAWSQSEQGIVKLEAEKKNGHLSILLVNTKTAGQAGWAGTGTGLRNTKERLNLVYQDDASLEVHNADTEFTVEINLPWEVNYS